MAKKLKNLSKSEKEAASHAVDSARRYELYERTRKAALAGEYGEVTRAHIKALVKVTEKTHRKYSDALQTEIAAVREINEVAA